MHKTATKISPGHYCRATFFIAALLCLFPALSFSAGPESSEQQKEESIYVMPEVVVESERIAATTGLTILDKDLIDSLPQGNGSVNEIIGSSPGVQYSEDSNASYTGGEITPPVLSISGSRFYDNNYTIDGLGNNSSLHPAYAGNGDAHNLPSHPQKQFLNPRLIEQVTVYNSNIPAEFGGFTGGQINTTIIEPSPEFWGQLSYRTTRDEWTKFHLDPDKEEEFYAAEDTEYQPEFSKHDYGLTLNVPLSPDTAFISAYQQITSDIRQRHLGSIKHQSRVRENLLFKINHYFPDNSSLSATGIYSPTTTDSYSSNWENSDYSVKTDNYSLGTKLSKQTELGQWDTIVGLVREHKERNASNEKYCWLDNNGVKRFSGGVGQLQNGQDDISLKTSMKLDDLILAQTEHRISFGFEATYTRGYYRRKQNVYYYYNCEAGHDTCVNPTSRTVYYKINANDSSSYTATYLQDSILWKRIELFPGLRLSHSNLTNDYNWAPRLSASLDVWGNNNTILFASKDRYYSSQMLNQTSFNPTVNATQTRANDATAWTDKSINHFYTDKLNTPYADEYSLGFIQRILGGELKAQYIHKQFEDEFSRSQDVSTDTETGITHRYYTLNNNGESEHASYQLSWSRNWKKHYLEVNGTWQETTTSNDTYADYFSEEDADQTYWYKGKEYYIAEMPKENFNRPFIGNLIYRVRMPYSVTFTNILKYRGKYYHLTKLKEDNIPVRKPSQLNPDQASEPYVYVKAKEKSAIDFDWNISWRVPGFRSYQPILSVDVLNVFNKRIKQGSTDEYTLGRQFWAGVDVIF